MFTRTLYTKLNIYDEQWVCYEPTNLYYRVTTHIRQTDEMKTLDRKKCMPIAMITFKMTHKQGKKVFQCFGT